MVGRVGFRFAGKAWRGGVQPGSLAWVRRACWIGEGRVGLAHRPGPGADRGRGALDVRTAALTKFTNGVTNVSLAGGPGGWLLPRCPNRAARNASARAGRRTQLAQRVEL